MKTGDCNCAVARFVFAIREAEPSLDCALAFTALELVDHGLAPVHVGLDVISVERSYLGLQLSEILFELRDPEAFDKVGEFFTIVTVCNIGSEN